MRINEFKKELASLINRHSLEIHWDMPDFLMAEVLTQIILSTGKTMRDNLDWHGTDSVCHPKKILDDSN